MRHAPRFRRTAKPNTDWSNSRRCVCVFFFFDTKNACERWRCTLRHHRRMDTESFEAGQMRNMIKAWTRCSSRLCDGMAMIFVECECQKTGFRRERAHKRVYSVLLLLCVGCSISIERQMLWLLSHLLDQIAVAHITHDILFFVSPASISLSLFSYHTYRCDPPMQAGTTKLIAIQCTIFPCQTIIIIFLHVLADHEILSGGCRPRPHNDTHLDSNMSVLHAGPEEHVTCNIIASRLWPTRFDCVFVGFSGISLATDGWLRVNFRSHESNGRRFFFFADDQIQYAIANVSVHSIYFIFYSCSVWFGNNWPLTLLTFHNDVLYA